MDRDAARVWVEAHVVPTVPLELTHERPWSTVLRVPSAEGTAVYLDRSGGGSGSGSGSGGDLRRLRILDWGDSSISLPLASLVTTFRLLEERNGLTAGDPWFARLRDTYLEPWGSGLVEVFDVAMQVGHFANALAALRQREALAGPAVQQFDQDLRVRVRRAVAVATVARD